MNERAEFERLPEWAPEYLACWGSTKPDGGRMTVTFAAEYAGVTPSTVRDLRARSPQFQRMEYLARNGTSEWMQSYIQAAGRAFAPLLVDSMYRLLSDGHPQATLKMWEWARGKPDLLDITSGGGPIKGYIGFSPDEWDDDLDYGDPEGDEYEEGDPAEA